MKKFLTAALAAATLAGALAATAAPAEARDYRHHRSYHHRGGNDAGVAIAAGVVGLALGAALADNDRGSSYYGDRGYYAPQPRYGYYDRPGYAYAPPYRTCESRERTYDPYIGRQVMITRRYAC